MKNYVISTRITATLSGLSFIVALILHYGFHEEEAEFWCNVCLAAFGSGLLTFITSCIGYAAEKRRTLEGFSYSTRFLLHVLNKYDLNWNLEKKIDFFLDYADIDESTWDAQLGSIYFMFDPGREKFKYIYWKIYKPILDLNRKIAAHEFHFKWHKDGSGKNDAVMTTFVDEIEELFMEKLICKHTLEDGQEMQATTIQNKLVHTALEELNGKYYDIMYGKKHAEREDT